MKRIKQGMFTLAASALILTAAVTNTHAYDAPELSFYPVSSWEMTQIEDPASGQQLCLMMNEYNNGYILQFQGAQGNIQSLSIDFRQDAFAAGQEKTFSLTLPGQTSASLPAMAFSPDVLAVNMSGHDAVFSSLKQANAMDINVDDNEFRFFMTGFANAVHAFESCLNPQSPDAPISQIPAEPVPQEDSTTLASSAEPERAAPSRLMQDMSQEAQKKYAQELSVILQEPEEKVSAELQKALEREQKVLIEDDDLNLKPAPGKRYTETIAEQMGTPKEKDIAAQDITAFEPIEDTADTAAAAPAPLPDEDELSAPVKDEITWNAPPQSKKVEITAIEMTEAPPSSEPQDDLVEELAEFVHGDSSKDVVAAEITKDEGLPEYAEEAPTPDPVMTPPPQDPVVHSYTTPEPKITKEVYKSEADFTNMPVREIGDARAKPPFSERYAAAVSSEKVEKLENRIERLKRENEALNTELDTALKAGAQERLEISSENWNLEQATMRFNEAERQIAMLGQQIQKERAQCAYEKKELEMMLFDPQVTEEAQLARLASLEKKIRALESEMEEQAADYERRIQALKMQVSQ